jgi:hypothetical protein
VGGQLTVKDPRITGTGQYQFSAEIIPGGAAQPRTVRITVERGPDGYAVRGW